MIPTRRFRRPTGPDRFAVVSAEPSAQPGLWVIRLARGASAGALAGGTVYGPFPLAIASAKADEVAAQLAAEGFAPAVHEELIEALGSPDAGRRARAAQSLGWRRERAVVATLLEAAAQKGTDLPVIVEALGRIGDPAAIPIARELAGKKLLSRRRAGIEALHALHDAEGLADARNAGLVRLPPAIASVIGSLDEHDLRKANVKPLIDAITALEPNRKALCADQLYEIGTPALLAVARRTFLAIDVSAPHAWRYAKSTLKRAMLREDGRTLGLLVRAIEMRAAGTAGKTASVKSGLDGQVRTTRIFGRATQRWAKRATDRYLRRIARWRPDRYAEIAAEVLAAYRPEDRALKVGGLAHPLGHLHLLARILYGRSARLVRDPRTLAIRWASQAAMHASPSIREELYPELWDARPSAYLRVLTGGSVREVLDFAVAGFARHPALAIELPSEDLAELLGSDHEGVAAIALAELERRFDPDAPDLALLERLLESESASVRARGASLLERARRAWWADPEAVLSILLRERPAARVEVARLVALALGEAPADARRAIAARLLERLREGGEDDRLAPIAEVLATALRAEAATMLSSTELLAWIDRGPSAARVAGRLLAGRPDALHLLGLPRLTLLAESEVRSVREAALALLEGAGEELAADPSPLLALAESRWADVRGPAIARLRALFSVERHGLETLVAICDSNRPDVQALGRELAAAHVAALDADALLHRLIEHPRAPMRAFAIELLEKHLRPGLVPLLRCETFFRTVLLEVRADADTKRRALAFLVARGLADAEQGALAAQILERLLRTRTVRDFERVVSGLATIQARWPSVTSALVLGAP